MLFWAVAEDGAYRMRATSAVLVSTKLPGTDNPGLQVP